MAGKTTKPITPTATCQQWIADPKAEFVLKQLSLRYDTGPVPMASIDWPATESNAGRTGRQFAPETVDDYATAMENGANFPMPVAIVEKGKAKIVAGVHRSKAAKQVGFKQIECYILTAQSEAVTRLVAIMTNRKEGTRVSKQEAIEYAVHLVTEYDMDAKQVSDLLGIKRQAILDKVRIVARRRELASLGVDARLNDTVVESLALVSGNQKTLVAAAQLASKYKLSGVTVRDMAQRVVRSKTEAQQLAAIEKEAEAIRVTTPGPSTNVVMSLRTKVLRAFNALSSAIGIHDNLEQLQIVRGSNDHTTLAKEWKLLKRRIDSILS